MKIDLSSLIKPKCRLPIPTAGIPSPQLPARHARHSPLHPAFSNAKSGLHTRVIRGRWHTTVSSDSTKSHSNPAKSSLEKDTGLSLVTLMLLLLDMGRTAQAHPQQPDGQNPLNLNGHGQCIPATWAACPCLFNDTGTEVVGCVSTRRALTLVLRRAVRHYMGILMKPPS